MSLEPYFSDGQITLYLGDCLEVLVELSAAGVTADVCLTDPPYGDTSLKWDRCPDPAWLHAIPANALWCFGSMRFWLTEGHHFREAGWKYAQDIVWEKHTGSGFATDRFKRVHEHAVQWYRGEWAALAQATPTTMVYGSGAHKTVRRRADRKPAHTGDVGQQNYESFGERLQRTVIACRSERGRAVHPTQKPLGILRPLITYSCPRGGTVLDPYAGSGSTLLAARDEGRKAIGIEVCEDYCEAAVRRFGQASMDFGAAA